MTEEWFQLWSTLPVLGRQWGGWLRCNRVVAQGLVETFATSAAKAVGVTWTLLDANGHAVAPMVVGLPTIPGWTF